jgi:3-oxoacyl-[acyl-carrier protein] reductase
MNGLFDLSGKTALITGSARGLGRGIALHLAKHGVKVLANVRSESGPAGSLLAKMQKYSAKSCLLVADVSEPEQVEHMFVKIAEEHKGLDILVNNAGMTQEKDIEQISLDDWQRVMTVNLTGNYLCAKHALALMKNRGWGRIIQISSMVGHQGALFGHVHYAASKSGQMGFTKTLARTCAPHGITVNAVAPGIIETNMLQKVHGPEKLAELSAGVPLGLGHARDVAHAVHFLASDEAGYITGTTLDVNGGMLMR